MDVKNDDLTIELENRIMRKVGEIAAYDMADMKDALMQGLLTEEEYNNMGVDESIRISRLFYKLVVRNYIQIVNISEFMAMKYNIFGLNEKDERTLRNEIMNLIRRVLTQELNQIYRMIIQSILGKMENKPLSVEERLSLVDDLYIDIQKEYRRNNNEQKRINESVNLLVDYMQKTVLNEELIVLSLSR